MGNPDAICMKDCVGAVQLFLYFWKVTSRRWLVK